jgi:hypothetical protein
MFQFVIKYAGFLKSVPLLPQVFESWLKIITLFRTPQVLTCMDEIELEVMKWENISVVNHKYGGMQFNKNGHEIGHIHGNGLLDIPFNKKLKHLLMEEGKINEHHTIKNSGWSSFYIQSKDDKGYALKLLQESYKLRK